MAVGCYQVLSSVFSSFSFVPVATPTLISIVIIICFIFLVLGLCDLNRHDMSFKYLSSCRNTSTDITWQQTAPTIGSPIKYWHTREACKDGAGLEDVGALAWWHFVDGDGHTEDGQSMWCLSFPSKKYATFERRWLGRWWRDCHVMWRNELFTLPFHAYFLYFWPVCSSTCPRTHHNFVFVFCISCLFS